MKGRVYVAGTGIISAIGNSVSDNFSSLKNSTSGIGMITHLETIHRDSLPAGEVKLTDEELSRKLNHAKVTRTALLGIHAAREAVANSRLTDLRSYRTGLISATTVGGMDRTENFFPDFINDDTTGRLRDVVHHACGSTTEIIAEDLGITGFIATVNTACSSSVNAIILGTRLIQNGMLDVVVAGGTDALTKFTLNGFNSLMILDKELCRPFDASRKGLNLGEGAGYVVLVSERIASRENIEIPCLVSGYANTNDAFHQTASSPEGRGSFAAMKNSLEMAGLQTTDIDYINLHGTGTVNNDQSEGTAIRRLFGETVPFVSSTKSFTGHTLGACGGIEAVYSVMAIQHRSVFPNLRFRQPMADIDISPVDSFRPDLQIRHVMSNSFGFGGNCSSIIFSKS